MNSKIYLVFFFLGIIYAGKHYNNYKRGSLRHKAALKKSHISHKVHNDTQLNEVEVHKNPVEINYSSSKKFNNDTQLNEVEVHKNPVEINYSSSKKFNNNTQLNEVEFHKNPVEINDSSSKTSNPSKTDVHDKKKTDTDKRIERIQEENEKTKKIIDLFNDYKENVHDDKENLQEFLNQAEQIEKEILSLLGKQSFTSKSETQKSINIDYKESEFSDLKAKVNKLRKSLNETSKFYF